MKKPAKLLLCKETLRTLTEVKLVHVVSGTDTNPALAWPPTALKECPAAAAVAAIVVGGSHHTRCAIVVQ